MGTKTDIEMEKFIRKFMGVMNTLSSIPRDATTLERVADLINPLSDEAQKIIKMLDKGE